jgi:hypothetical protein
MSGLPFSAIGHAFRVAEPRSDEASAALQAFCHKVVKHPEYARIAGRVQGIAADQNATYAMQIVGIILPGWGCRCSWSLSDGSVINADVFRKRGSEQVKIFGSRFTQAGEFMSTGERAMARCPALAILAALCYALAWLEEKEEGVPGLPSS